MARSIVRPHFPMPKSMHPALIATGATGVFASAVFYVVGYFKGKAKFRDRWNAILEELAKHD
jgi:hypothetical protein